MKVHVSQMKQIIFLQLSLKYQDTSKVFETRTNLNLQKLPIKNFYLRSKGYIFKFKLLHNPSKRRILKDINTKYGA